MLAKVLTLGLALVFLAAQSPTALARSQTTPAAGAWDAVRAVASGTRLEVRLKSGKTVKGKLDSVSDTGLVLAGASGATNINREDVQRVYSIHGKSSAKPALIGAGIGAVIGVGGAAASAKSDDKEGVRAGAALLPLVGAAGGALIGLAFRRQQKRVLIYESL